MICGSSAASLPLLPASPRSAPAAFPASPQRKPSFPECEKTKICRTLFGVRQFLLYYKRRLCSRAQSSQYAGTGEISVVDLLDVADVHIVQHITAMSQDPGEGSDCFQHRNLLSIFLYLFDTGISYCWIMNELCTFCEYTLWRALKYSMLPESVFVSDAQLETFPFGYNTEFKVYFFITIAICIERGYNSNSLKIQIYAAAGSCLFRRCFDVSGAKRCFWAERRVYL